MKNTAFLVFMVFVMVLTFCLGSWQVSRHYEKLEKNQILSKSFSNVIPLPKEINVKNQAYHKFNILGVFDYSKQIAIGPRNVGEEVGRFIYTLFYTIDKRTLLVNRGFIPEEKVNKVNTVGVSNPYRADLILIANKDRKWFLPKNNPKQGSWIYIDTKEIGRFFDVELDDYYFNLTHDIKFDDGVKPFQSEADYKLFNPHYKYAVFWFSMFFTILIMILIFYKRKDA